MELRSYFVLIFFISFSSAIQIKCNFKKSRWIPELPAFYECEGTSNVIETIDDANITGIIGSHLPDLTNLDVHSIYLYRSRPIRFFPQNLEKFFPNLQIIAIVLENLREITQKDLKNYPKLKVLYLDSNEIERLEKDLFAKNPKLEFINLSNNRINFVDLSVFKRLPSLKTLWFENNFCYSRKVENNRVETLNLIGAIRESCYVDEVLEKFNEFGIKEVQELKNEIQRLKDENAKIKEENENLKMENLRLKIECEIKTESLEKCEESFDECQKDLKNLTKMAIERCQNL